jgi:FkbM family methyltransferase
MSVRLECPQLDASNIVALGTPTRWTVAADRPGVETRVFLRQHAVRYPTPVRDWSSEPWLDVFPESPGEYALLVHWRDPASGTSGWAERAFIVGSGRRGFGLGDAGRRLAGGGALAVHAADLCPTEVTLGRDLRFWVPSGWEGSFFAANEAPIVEVLARETPASGTAWDVGANLGVYSVALARKVGKAGRVVCFEANPVCVYFLRVNLLVNHADNCEILPVALDDHEGEVPFSLNFGNSNLGVDLASPIFASKPGQRVLVPGRAADDLVKSGELSPPAVVKIDVEGAEGAVLRGMRETLARHRPRLLVEMHGRVAAEAACQVLDPFDYGYTVVPGGPSFARARDLLAAFPDQVWQVLARPR